MTSHFFMLIGANSYEVHHAHGRITGATRSDGAHIEPAELERIALHVGRWQALMAEVRRNTRTPLPVLRDALDAFTGTNTGDAT